MPASTASYDTITAAEIGNSEATAAERSIPEGTTNITLTSSDLQGTTAGNVLRLQFGFNDGVSTTWYTTSGDYRRNLESDITNSVTDRVDIHVFEDAAAGGTLSRPHAWSFSADCLHLAVPTTTVGCEYFNDSSPGSTNDGAFLTHVMTDPVPVNRFRVFFEATTGASGSIRVKYETRPVVLISTLDLSTGGTTRDVDVSGYSSVRVVSVDGAYTGAESGRLHLSYDGGSTFDTNTANSNTTTENGNSSGAFATDGVALGASSASLHFTTELFNLDLDVPKVSYSTQVEVGLGTARRNFGINGLADTVTHIRLTGFAATAFSTGTAYVVGDTTPSVLIGSTAMTSYTDPGTLAANPNPVVSHNVSAYGRITACAFSATTAAATQVKARISDDSGLTFETTGYSFKVEDGSDEAQRSEALEYPISTSTAGTSTNAAFMMFAENVNLEAPMFGWGAQFATQGKTSSMVKANTPVTNFGVQFWDAASTDHVAGSTGTVYLVGRA